MSDPLEVLQKMLEELAVSSDTHSIRAIVEAAEKADIPVSADAKRMKKSEIIAMLRQELGTTTVVDVDGSDVGAPLDGETPEAEEAPPEEVFSDEKPPEVKPMAGLVDERYVEKYALADGFYRVGPEKVALNKGQKVKLTKYVADFLQARGKVSDQPPKKAR